MALTKLELGPINGSLFTFVDEDGSLFSAEYTSGMDVIGLRLTVDASTCIITYPFDPTSAEVIGGIGFTQILTSDGYAICSNKEYIDMRNVPFGTEAKLYRRDKLFMKLYKNQAKKITKTKYSISFVSAIGLLDGQKHLGGFYNSVRFDSVVDEIIDGAAPYTMDDNVASLLVRGGYLPYQSKRENLHWICFAYGVMIGRNENGDMHFRFIRNSEAIQVPEGTIYEGGDIADPDGATAVDVTEHSFMALPTDEEVVVYDNTDGSETADNTFISFGDNAPLHDLVATGSLVIHSSDANWAVISGTGVLSGKKYTHSTRILTRYENETERLRDKVADLTKNTMVTVLNSENVAARMLAYYAHKRVVTTSMVIDGQALGDLLSGIDPFGDRLTGFLSSVHGIISTKIKGTCELISDYIPTGQGSNYTHAIVLTGDGVWEIPQEVFEKENPIIQVTVISGGHGGFSGKDGEARDGGFYEVGAAKTGGEGGEPGPGGRVITVTIDCTDRESFMYHCGEGGESEQEGTDTMFGEHSSADGVPAPYGVTNIFTGEVYGTTGAEKGVTGGKGNPDGAAITYKGLTWYPSSVMGKDVRGKDSAGDSVYANGGYGGGAAVGSDGAPGGDGDLYNNPDGTVFASGGTGGKGADAAAGDDSAVLGGGGNGGHGGGGGGQGGSASGSASNYTSQGYSGSPGKGGAGGKGGPGMILIYF